MRITLCCYGVQELAKLLLESRRNVILAAIHSNGIRLDGGLQISILVEHCYCWSIRRQRNENIKRSLRVIIDLLDLLLEQRFYIDN